MPIHIYRCAKGHTLERGFKVGQKPNTLQCECGGKATRTIIMPQIAFKGEGFSRTAKQPTDAAMSTEKMYKDNGLIPRDDIVVEL